MGGAGWGWACAVFALDALDAVVLVAVVLVAATFAGAAFGLAAFFAGVAFAAAVFPGVVLAVPALVALFVVVAAFEGAVVAAFLAAVVGAPADARVVRLAGAAFGSACADVVDLAAMSPPTG